MSDGRRGKPPVMPEQPHPLAGPTDAEIVVTLALESRLGWRLISRLIVRFGTPARILRASESQLMCVRGIGAHLARQIRTIGADGGESIARSQALLRQLRASGIHYATWRDHDYPAALKPLGDRPALVFWRGQFDAVDTDAIGIVGTRTPDAESVSWTLAWSAALAQRGWTVVSGLARGTDTHAHRGALSRRDLGRTIAVLGSGLMHIYPPENSTLADEICGSADETRGVVLCEVHPESAPTREALVIRNRLIAAISRAVIVVEAGASSGALHAARYMHRLGRPVYALPKGEGCRALLADFAHPVPRDVSALIDQLRAHEAAAMQRSFDTVDNDGPDDPEWQSFQPPLITE